MTDYPDYAYSSVSTPTGEVSSGYQTLWSTEYNNTVAAEDTWTITITPGDDDYYYQIDAIYVMMYAIEPLHVHATINDEWVGGATQNGSIELSFADNPLVEIGYDDTFKLYITNLGASSYYIEVVILGKYRYMSGGYTRTPMAWFSGTPTSGTSPLSVTFTDESSRLPTAWIWDFGDESALVYTQNPTHEYSAVGVYNVTLIASNAAGRDTRVRTDYITVVSIIDFSSYTEVDPSSYLTISTTKVEWTSLPRNVDAYLYYDYGTDNFDALDVDFDLYLDAHSTYGRVGALAFTNTVDDANAFASTDLSVVTHKTNSTTHKIRLIRGNDVAYDEYTCSTGTTYYCTLVRAAGNDTATLYIYSDSDRTSLLDTLVVTGFSTTKWRYNMAGVSYNSGNAYAASGWIDNVYIN